MIRKTLLLIAGLALSAAMALSACSNVSATRMAEQKTTESQLSVTAASVPQVREHIEEEQGSLWNSELFNDSRFMLSDKLTVREEREARKLARGFESHMEMSSLFMYHLLSELKERNMPLELAALPLVESGFNPRAQSGAGAHGPWQFIRSTGKALGLTRSANYDEFYDFVESTDASLRYLQYLHDECGNNWDLAVAAYNQGEATVKRAIARARAAGVKNINFRTVKLSAGANTYVTRFHAYVALLRYPERYGVSRPDISNSPAFRRVQVAGRIDSMKQAARLSGVEVSTLKHLNAGYLSDSLHSDKQRGLLVPVENASRLERAIGIDKHRKSSRTQMLSASAGQQKSADSGS